MLTFFPAVFQGTSCEKHWPVVALALGIENPARLLPGASPMPRIDSVIETSLEAYCPSFCFRAVKNIIDEYSTRNALKGRLCPQIMDGLWRLKAVCARDGKDDMSGSYCLAHYVKVSEGNQYLALYSLPYCQILPIASLYYLSNRLLYFPGL